VLYRHRIIKISPPDAGQVLARAAKWFCGMKSGRRSS
jgi:hypothetical protein